ncbi:MAG TPA: M23 family metallopeptidase [Kribbella sp.]|jgi:murein DD-endopeptidase MepM/ murein hydrolase activator NlpD
MRKVQLFGLTAALAAAAGTAAFSLNQAPAITPTANSSKPGTITTARINRSALGSRDASRAALTLDSTRKKQADSAAQASAAKLAASQTLSARRAVALQAAKAAAAAKAAKEQAEQEAATVAQQQAKQEAATVAQQQAKQEAATVAQQQAKQTAAAAAKKKTAEQVSISTTAIMLPVHAYTLTARFGQAGGRWSHFHTGLDFAAPIGTPIQSVMAGRVIFAAFAGAYGRQVQVRHYDGTVTSYSHMSAFSVSVGQAVRAGGQVGAVGVTGNTTGPHVHLEVRPGGGAPIDPEPWLRAHGLHP